jgi:hypothetical protein
MEKVYFANNRIGTENFVNSITLDDLKKYY